MYCPNCRKRLKNDAVICMRCGTVISPSDSSENCRSYSEPNPDILKRRSSYLDMAQIAALITTIVFAFEGDYVIAALYLVSMIAGVIIDRFTCREYTVVRQSGDTYTEESYHFDDIDLRNYYTVFPVCFRLLCVYNLILSVVFFFAYSTGYDASQLALCIAVPAVIINIRTLFLA